MVCNIYIVVVKRQSYNNIATIHNNVLLFLTGLLVYVLPVAAVMAIAVLGGVIGVITMVCCLNRKKRKREEFAGLESCWCL